MKKLSKTCIALILPLSLVWACGSSSDVGNDHGNGAGSGSGGSVGSAGTLNIGDGLGGADDGTGATTGATSATGGSLNGSGGTLTATGGVAATGTTACTDGNDNDDDGLSDGFDPECTGPGDNDEGTFATGIPGDNKDGKWQDCFFDGNSGAGEDGCRYATGCLTGDLAADHPDCELTDACIKFCAPLTPNGCDCFGCCTVELGNGDSLDIQTASSCSLDNVQDEEACPRCVKSDACGNTCGRCELCPGKTVADLPEDCGPSTGVGGANSGTGGGPTDGPTYTCDGGEQVCGPDLPTCAVGSYCSLGCCLVHEEPK